MATTRRRQGVLQPALIGVLTCIVLVVQAGAMAVEAVRGGWVAFRHRCGGPNRG